MTIKTRNIADSAVTAIKLAAGAVTAAKLSTTMATGYIDIPLHSWRLINAGNTDYALVAATAAIGSGGVGGVDGDPKLIRENVATDKAAKLSWAAASVKEIMNDVVFPPDLDETAVVTFKMLARMAGATDIPVVTVGFWQQGQVGAYSLSVDTGGATAAVTGTSNALYSRVITAANVGAPPRKASITLIPAAHGTDALFVYATWLEYTRF